MKTKLLLSVFALVICNSIYFETVTAQCYEFYVVSPYGGEYEGGAICKTDENGNGRVVTSLFRIDGSVPYGQLCSAFNGKLYGLTSAGGAFGYGVIFEWDPVTGIYSKKIDFDGKTNGGCPYGSLIQADNGKLYGMTSFSGNSWCGVLFEWDPFTNICTKKIDFYYENCSFPYGSLVQAHNRLIYGMTSAGGANDCGVLFEWNPDSNNFVKKLDFSATENGSNPHGSLIEADNGKLYGMTKEGGLYGLGVLFEWDIATDSFCKRLDFNGTENGSHPEGSLAQADNGKLYGMTYDGGLNNYGVLFEWDPCNNVFSKKLDFNGTENGSHPKGSLTKMENGILVGITSSGVLFEWDPVANNYNKKFNIQDIDRRNGRLPNGSLVQADNGKLYGMTIEGGIYPSSGLNISGGVLYEWDPVTNMYSAKLRFTEAENGMDPINLVEADNGKFYGITGMGGIEDFGVIFEYDPSTGTYTKKFDFTGGWKVGAYPIALIKANNGKLYGCTRSTPDVGSFETFYEWDTATDSFALHFTINYDLLLGSNLIQGNNNKIYGTTRQGGEKGGGFLFEWDLATHTYTEKFDFASSGEDGKWPQLLVKARNGKIYGYTDCCGGLYNKGVLFEWDPATDNYVKRLDLNDSVRISSLIQAQNNKFYGVFTENGERGIFYEWDAETNAYTVKFEIHVKESWSYPLDNDLTLGDNGKLYGTIFYKEPEDPINEGNANSNYYVYEWDPLNNNYEEKFNINWTNGRRITELLVKRKGIISDTLNAVTCADYISPSGKYTWTESGEYKDTIPNAAGCDSIITICLTIQTIDTSVTQNGEVLSANESEAIYQWIDCNNDNVPIEGETQKTFTPSTGGTYAVIITQNDCTDTSACFTINSTGTQIGTFGHNIIIYPNPNDGSFSIDLGKAYPKTEITIIDLSGRVIEKKCCYNSQIIDSELNLSPGVYLGFITCENNRIIIRILIQ